MSLGFHVLFDISFSAYPFEILLKNSVQKCKINRQINKSKMKNILHKTLAVSLILPTLFLSACQPSKPKVTATPDTIVKTTAAVPVTTTSTMQTEAPKKGDQIVTIETDKGTIKFKLFPTAAPETVKNFTELAKTGKYDNVPFHRVIEGFMIQTGDFTNKNGTGGYSYKGPKTQINDEFTPDLVHVKGTVSMANSGPNTNGSQFFIVTADKGVSYLNNHYSVFGQVFEGQDIVDAISKVKTGPNDKPVEPINMKKVTVSTF